MILVVGIDGYSYDWRHWLEEDGFHTGVLDSPHALSGPAWTSIFTGLTAEGHGIPHVPKPGMLKGLKRPAYVWDHLAAANMESVAVNVPFTYPPRLVRRLLVCGYPVPRKNRAFPRKAAMDWNWRDLDLYYAHRGEPSWDFLACPDKDLMETCRKARWSLGHHFLLELKKGHPDLAILCLTDLDRLAHYAYRTFRQEEVLESVVADMRLLLARLEFTLYPEWIFVVSDHALDLTDEPRAEDGWALCHGPKYPHTRRGLIAYKGPQARPVEDLSASVEDVTPTLLYLLDAAPSSRIEGTALTEISEGGAADEQEILEQLEGLGYV